jgi:hypothetical protein
MADEDQDKKTTTTTKKTTGVREPEPVRVSTVTAAPENPAGVEAEPDDQAFFSSGHGPALHYDRRERGAEQEPEREEA